MNSAQRDKSLRSSGGRNFFDFRSEEKARKNRERAYVEADKSIASCFVRCEGFKQSKVGDSSSNNVWQQHDVRYC